MMFDFLEFTRRSLSMNSEEKESFLADALDKVTGEDQRIDIWRATFFCALESGNLRKAVEALETIGRAGSDYSREAFLSLLSYAFEEDTLSAPIHALLLELRQTEGWPESAMSRTSAFLLVSSVLRGGPAEEINHWASDLGERMRDIPQISLALAKAVARAGDAPEMIDGLDTSLVTAWGWMEAQKRFHGVNIDGIEAVESALRAADAGSLDL